MKKKCIPYLLLAPLIVLMSLFCLALINSIVQSLGFIPALGLTKPTLSYYQEIFMRKDLLQSIWVSLNIAGISSIIAVILGTLLCYFLVSTLGIRKKTLSLVKIPIQVPHTIVGLMVIHLFSQTGLCSRMLYSVGLLSSPENFPSFLYSGNNAGIILAYLWKEIPFVCYFVLSIMSGINKSLGEASMNLGASRSKTFVHVTLPLCMPAIKNAFLIIFAFSFGAYELPFLLGATLPKALPIQAYVEYTHPDLRHRPYAMALNTIMLVISLLIAVLYHKLLQKQSLRKENGENET